ncbi:shikimate dehydrogenase [Clostridium pasteurianum DSM 525 = ATCC 6013]|uniref:Shikimate dehydrogenase (NADP(+)) n=1 Tax=Clostridium pasteurianum DSM 525 = ATCC 6013 TaxID=1262449 RepID=A0A0H3JBK0_CLOPA|nr:shikimate dehydrogenase [Clostridium pasteurianum]AJA49865.1 shikimate dehydrogenase [Clostridium pasteurianum DSM 525 = ATCC 6013]AJA53853.1 shikimate dehydrogenase [Clostridium pasteurianum DSM 525 = ATCC 6013]AOZ77008.1 shikimate dehydrogenase [Clostridium pasteurianum DSM 525 = ATCC 6013]AOZ80805.1 shikimate dehydrogenase [Clostridium pasteurianum]ELP57825.1 shikimate 5-dehydrogenase [Clostridium pasteurianum DSM 525 = ATCC 6013]
MTCLFGLIGEKLGHSVSPAIHSTIFHILEMDAEYKLFEIEKGYLKDGFKDLLKNGVKGLNVTIPYKVDIMSCLDEVSVQAEKIGAVNTVCFKENKIIGYNTDYYGFGRMLEKSHIESQNKKVVILGAGGAAKAVIQYFIDNSSKDIILVSRDKKKAAVNFKDIEIIDYEELKLLKSGDIIVNSTPCGMYPKVENSPVDENCVSKFSSAVDLIYNPKETLFLKFAKKRGIKAVNGLYMLVGQAVAAEELWNNITIEESVVDKIYDKFLKKQI